MFIKSRVLAASAALAVTGGLTLAAAGTAQASSTGCAFTNGCATLRGTDANGSTVAMDAKRQNKNEILIGYPDNAGDGATSFDGVLHYGKGTKTTSYADTGFTLSPTFTSIPCLLTTAPRSGHACREPARSRAAMMLTVQSSTGTATDSPSSGSSIALGGAGTLTVDEQYASDGTSCEAAYTGSRYVSGAPTLATAPDAASLTYPTSPGGSTWTFLDSNTGGTFKFTGLPAGIIPSGGSLTADTSTAVPGTYTNVGVTYTAPDGAVFTATFTLKVSGIKSTTPGAGVPYYTFVYAPAGDWTSQCVTDINGSGALRLVSLHPRQGHRPGLHHRRHHSRPAQQQPGPRPQPAGGSFQPGRLLPDRSVHLEPGNPAVRRRGRAAAGGPPAVRERHGHEPVVVGHLTSPQPGAVRTAAEGRQRRDRAGRVSALRGF